MSFAELRGANIVNVSATDNIRNWETKNKYLKAGY